MSSPEDSVEVPVLTEIVEDEPASAPPAIEPEQLTRALLERLAPELERLVREAVHQALAATKRG